MASKEAAAVLREIETKTAEQKHGLSPNQYADILRRHGLFHLQGIDEVRELNVKNTQDFIDRFRDISKFHWLVANTAMVLFRAEKTSNTLMLRLLKGV